MVNARPEQVWKHVVTFSELPEPKEWYFHAGLAYPKRARIVDQGLGAVRYCEFSTGPFVEPIEVWNEGRLLRFHVTENPAPLQEWGLYGPIGTRHLHGYLVLKRGQFRSDADGGRENAAGRNNVVSAWIVAGAVLAMVVGCDYSSDTPASTRSRSKLIRGRCAGASEGIERGSQRLCPTTIDGAVNYWELSSVSYT